MAYNLFWRSPALPYVQKQNAITVPAGAVVSNAASIRFTGKGATNYGKIQQENLMRLLESHAGDTAPPFPTVGQTWYDTSVGLLKVCTATPPLSISPVADWRALNSTYVTGPGDPPPLNPTLGDTWFQGTGPSSGIMYVYDHVGRYPLIDWDAHASGSFPAVATTNLGIILNKDTFAGPTSYGEAYIHGYTGATPADVPGSISTSIGTIAVPNSPLLTRHANKGFIAYDTSALMQSATDPAQRVFSVRKVGYDTWEYDNNRDWVPFVPVSNVQWIIGYIETGADFGAPGIQYGEVWSEGRSMTTSSVRHPPAITKTDGGIGGWSQVWPGIETVGGRVEFEEMYNTLMGLIGSPYTYGGSNALGKSVNFLTDMNTLDASMWARIFEETSPSNDDNISTNANGSFARVQPDSGDWDLLLAAMRYAVNRLELPSGSVNDISNVPFVQDGRTMPAFLKTLSTTDVLYPDQARRYPHRRYGVVSMLQAYTQTSNILEAALQNRYMMRGILGNSGSNTTFPTGVVLTSQQRFSITGSNLTGTLTHGLDYIMESGANGTSSAQLLSFFYSAQAIDIVMIHVPGGSPTAQDTNFAALLNSTGRIRITADQLLPMLPSLPTQLVAAPVAGGFNSVPPSGSITLHTLVGLGGAQVAIRAQRDTTNYGRITVFLDITPGGALSATSSTEIRWSYVDDQETYNDPGPVRVYPAPIPFVIGHRSGSTLFTPLGP